jgi:selenocysteine-specific elongation factor
MILDSMPNKRLSRSITALEALKTRENGSAEEIADLAAFELGRVLTDADLCRRADLDASTCREAIATLVSGGNIRQLLPGKYISSRTLAALGEKCTRLLRNYHAAQPLRSGMNIAELRQKLMPKEEIADAGAVLYALRDNNAITLSEKEAALPDFSIELSSPQVKIREKLLEMLRSAGFDTPSPDELAPNFEKSEKTDFDRVLESLISSGDLIQLSQQVIWTKEAFEKAVALLRSHFEKEDEITLAGCRDLLKTSRKYALAFLEYLDRKQATRKQGDARKLAKGLDF